MNDDNKQKLVQYWNNIRGDDVLRLHYCLTPDSTVFDIGAYKGEWVEKIVKLYMCKVHAFEPMPSFSLELLQKFKHNSNVHVANYGIMGRDCVLPFHFDEKSPNASSVYTLGNVTIPVLFRDIVGVIEEMHLTRVDLMKINVEGSEYEILTRLLDSGWSRKVTNIQVQFHDFIKDSVEMRDEIRRRLSETHHETYCVPFVWENWCLK